MGQWRATVELPGTLLAPRVGREVVSSLLTGWGHGVLVDDAALVVSELVTNAVQHAPGFETYELELIGRADGVRISLADGSSIRPIVGELAHEKPRGRGMQIVATLAQGWGAEDHHGGKRVWVELALPA